VRPHDRIPLLGLLCAAGLALSLAACGSSSRHTTTTVTTPASGHRPGLLSITQDDAALIGQDPGSSTAQTLATWKSLGVQVVRYNELWASTVPSFASRTKPAGFDAADPGSPDYDWAVMDAVDRDVAGAGMRLYLTLTAPAPLWATSPDAPTKDDCVFCDRYRPSAADYGQWVEAVGKRYDGHYTPPGQSTPLPRVSFWSIWNEPNYGPNLTPQSTENAQKQIVDTAAPQYRKLVEAAWEGLAATGHTTQTDTILIGETAPRGVQDPGIDQMTSPLQFIRDLYCVDGDYKPISDATVATALGCPTNGSSASFAKNNPALFEASGWADHPYPDGIPPNVKSGTASESVEWADFARLSDLEASLDKAATAWGSDAQLKIYDTEFGYFTNPPLRKYDAIAPATAAKYDNWAEYLSWKDPRIESYDQYLLVDPPASSTSKFDTGLEFSTGKLVPDVSEAIRLPLWLPTTTAKSGQALEVWGCARPALTKPVSTDKVHIQFASGAGAFKTLATVTVHPASSGCYFDTQVQFPASGDVRLTYTEGAHTVTSRTQAITVQ
jgi:hypothetical protein